MKKLILALALLLAGQVPAAPTLTFTITKTFTNSPTVTPTPTVTRTATKTVTSTSTITATATPTATRTASQTASPTVTRTASPTVSPTVGVPAASGAQVYTSSGTFTVPAGVTFITATMYGGGGGAAAGANSDLSSGADGDDGDDSWVGTSSRKARGGGHGRGDGAPPDLLAPVITSSLLQLGTACLPSPGVTTAGRNLVYQNGFAIPGAAQAPSAAADGTDGQANTGQAGGGGGEYNWGFGQNGGPGTHGEKAVAYIVVTPGQNLTVHIGDGGDGGGGGTGGDGGDGGKGLVTIEW